MARWVLGDIPSFHYAGRDYSPKFHAYIHAYPFVNRAYLPRLIPVEVDEPIARIWFKSLLSGVEFLHIRGVVHNDIKWVVPPPERFAMLTFFTRPANILLSNEDVPVLVDFGFAEKYSLGSSKAFKSNLAYGTPEVRLRRAYTFGTAHLANSSTSHQNGPAATTMTRASLTSGPLELRSSRS